MGCAGTEPRAADGADPDAGTAADTGADESAAKAQARETPAHGCTGGHPDGVASPCRGRIRAALAGSRRVERTPSAEHRNSLIRSPHTGRGETACAGVGEHSFLLSPDHALWLEVQEMTAMDER